MVKLVTLRESQIPPEELDYYSTVYAGRPMEYAAVELTYLAIDKDLQGLGLGTAVLKLLIHRVMEVSDVIPIRYLVLNALKAKVSFTFAQVSSLLAKEKQVHNLCIWIAYETVKHWRTIWRNTSKQRERGYLYGTKRNDVLSEPRGEQEIAEK